MRSHGVPNFPDPVGGHFGFTVDSGINPDTPQFEAAYSYCGKLYLRFHSPSPAELARMNAAAVKFSTCMRSHGATDFPDPDGKGAIKLPSIDYAHTPKVQRAEAACASLLANHDFVLRIPVPVH